MALELQTSWALRGMGKRGLLVEGDLAGTADKRLQQWAFLYGGHPTGLSLAWT